MDNLQAIWHYVHLIQHGANMKSMLQQTAFDGAIDSELIMALLKEISDRSYIFKSEACERSLNREGFSREQVMAHYLLIAEQEWIMGHVDIHQAKAVALRLSWSGHQMLKSLENKQIDVLSAL
ncbi:hypothetical protein [Chromobacterium sp. Beijing]|uniref:hypothetical protein n=1 Tax=Chromobacterium sp. Beijing TaxID=2735795 RepID=UPI001F1D6B70|nr:hypothetical protein [Chromobacterium sp. Beijing]UJB30313.1 DUF2513 domain-containing protein [Chromobacterium sp. Beijing]